MSSRELARMASSSMSTPQTWLAPIWAAAASTTPLPTPSSTTCLPRTNSGWRWSTWIRPAVYSLGRSAAVAGLAEAPVRRSGFDNSLAPRELRQERDGLPKRHASTVSSRPTPQRVMRGSKGLEAKQHPNRLCSETRSIGSTLLTKLLEFVRFLLGQCGVGLTSYCAWAACPPVGFIADSSLGIAAALLLAFGRHEAGQMRQVVIRQNTRGRSSLFERDEFSSVARKIFDLGPSTSRTGQLSVEPETHTSGVDPTTFDQRLPRWGMLEDPGNFDEVKRIAHELELTFSGAFAPESCE